MPNIYIYVFIQYYTFCDVLWPVTTLTGKKTETSELRQESILCPFDLIFQKITLGRQSHQYPMKSQEPRTDPNLNVLAP